MRSASSHEKSNLSPEDEQQTLSFLVLLSQYIAWAGTRLSQEDELRRKTCTNEGDVNRFIEGMLSQPGNITTGSHLVDAITIHQFILFGNKADIPLACVRINDEVDRLLAKARILTLQKLLEQSHEDLVAKNLPPHVIAFIQATLDKVGL